MTAPIVPTVVDTLEGGLDALAELAWDLHGFNPADVSVGLVYDSGLDGVGEVSSDNINAPGDGDVAGRQRRESLAITLGLAVVGQGSDPAAQAAAMATVLHDLRLVLSPLGDRWNGTRLFRWRRIGEPAKRIRYRPAGEPLSLPGDEARLLHASADVLCHIEAPDPMVCSDVLHTVELEANVLTNITNAGSFMPREPSVGFSLSCSNAGGVILTNTTYDASWKFPAGPVTVSDQLDIVGPGGSYGVVYGPGSSLFPASICLRPGVNVIKASQDCTFSWRDTY